MSSDNWTTCPQCVKILRDAKAIFVEKYYGKLDSELFLKISAEFDRKITHVNYHPINWVACNSLV